MKRWESKSPSTLYKILFCLKCLCIKGYRTDNNMIRAVIENGKFTNNISYYAKKNKKT
jgi:hypothetical protein